MPDNSLEPGQRLGLILEDDDEGVVKFLGYGKFIGYTTFPNNDEVPEFILDNGSSFFGNEVKWLAEELMPQYILGKKIIPYHVEIDDELEFVKIHPLQ